MVECICAEELDLQGTKKGKGDNTVLFFTDYAGLPIQASLGTRPDCVLGGKLLGGNSKTIVRKFWKFSCDS